MHSDALARFRGRLYALFCSNTHYALSTRNVKVVTVIVPWYLLFFDNKLMFRLSLRVFSVNAKEFMDLWVREQLTLLTKQLNKFVQDIFEC